MEVIKLFDIPKEVINDNQRQRRVYSVNGISPTILGRSDTAKIMEKRIGNIFGFDGGNYAGNVYDSNFNCPTLNTMQGGCKQPMVIENIPCATSRVSKGEFVSSQELKLINVGQEEAGTILSRYWKGIEGDHSNAIIVAMRGRNPNNPSDMTVGAPTEQRLEPNSQGICNTLTSVQKDNLVMEKVKIKQATKDGYIECDVGGVADLSFPDSKTRRGRVQENGQVSPTLMAGESDICRIEKKCISTKGKENEVASTILAGYERTNMTGFNADNGVVEMASICVGGLQEHQTPRTDGISPSLTAAMGMGGGQTPLINCQYRIRKLTPKECWRLMDFKDEDFEKAAQVNSNTQLYKQAGNSICRNVIIAILGQMIPGKEDVYKEINNVKT